MSKRSLLVIKDETAYISLPERIADFPVKIVDWQDVAATSSITDDAVLVDIDLQDSSKIKSIKSKLPHLVGQQCRMIAVDRGNHLLSSQANSLGATGLLERPLDIRSLKAHLRRHFATQASGPDADVDSDQRAIAQEPGAASVQSAAIALDSIFKAITCGGALEMGSVAQAGDRVIDAIAEVGLRGGSVWSASTIKALFSIASL